MQLAVTSRAKCCKKMFSDIGLTICTSDLDKKYVFTWECFFNSEISWICRHDSASILVSSLHILILESLELKVNGIFESPEAVPYLCNKVKPRCPSLEEPQQTNRQIPAESTKTNWVWAELIQTGTTKSHFIE